MKKLGYIHFRPAHNQALSSTIGLINRVMQMTLPNVEIIKDSVAPDLIPYEIFIVDLTDISDESYEGYVYNTIIHSVEIVREVPLRREHKRILSTSCTWIRPEIMAPWLIEDLLIEYNSFPEPPTYILFEEYDGKITYSKFTDTISKDLAFSIFKSHIT